MSALETEIKEARGLHGRLSLITHSIYFHLILPYSVCFLGLALDIGKAHVITTVIAFVITMPPVFIGWDVIRYRHLRIIHRHLTGLLEGASPGEEKLRESKLKLLGLPLFECLLASVVNLTALVLFFASLLWMLELSNRQSVHLLVGLICQLPLSGSLAYIIAEQEAARVLKLPVYEKVSVSANEYRSFPVALRHLLPSFSSFLFTAGMIGYLFWLSLRGEASISSSVLLILLIMAALNAFTFSYLSLRGIRSGIQDIRGALEKIAEGEISAGVATGATDEFGVIAGSLNTTMAALREVVGSASATAIRLSRDAAHLSASGTEIEKGSREQSNSVLEIIGFMEGMGAAAGDMANNAGAQVESCRRAHSVMRDLDQSAREIVQYSEAALEQTDEFMRKAELGGKRIRDDVRIMAGIREKTENIREFLLAIDEISDRVNLLSLNASIEAARAGVHGRGFAVVAGEISRLAEKTSESSTRIGKLLSLALAEVNRGHASLGETSHLFTELMERIHSAAGTFDEIRKRAHAQNRMGGEARGDFELIEKRAGKIADAARGQHASQQEITRATHELEQALNSVFHSLREMLAAATGFKQMAADLKERIHFFRIKENGSVVKAGPN